MIATPLLKLLLKISDLTALASPLPVIIPAALAGAFNYWRKGLVRWTEVRWALMGGFPALFIGALLTTVFASYWLMLLTGIFVVLVGISMVKSVKTPIIAKSKAKQHRKLLLIGAVSGFFGGLLAIGGGIILIPAVMIFLGYSMHQAAALSLIYVAILAIPGTLIHLLLGNIDVNLAINLSLGVIPASYLGSTIALRIPSGKLKKIFGIMLILFGAYFIFMQLSI